LKLAAEPEATNTEENNITEQMQGSAEVKSHTTEPVDEPQEIIVETPPEEVQSSFRLSL
jgi:hypothetical protein